LRVIGDLARFDDVLTSTIRQAEQLTAGNTALTLTIAANYGGRWDILNAMNRMLAANPDRHGGFAEEDLTPYLCLADVPEPDLFIRTGGEQRVSNFLLWQLAYTEFYFTDCLWPDFSKSEFEQAIRSYQRRERRFGRTSEQLVESIQNDKQE
jgi:undecaprenyl diphosphate synthase